MANVRSRFDSISAYLSKAHEARTSEVRGRRCIGIAGATFMAVHGSGLGFRLHGRAFRQAMALPGVRPWHPIDPARTAPGWVLVPSQHAWRWDRLAIDALRSARVAAAERFSREAAAGIPAPSFAAPAPSTGASLAARVKAAIARGFSGMTVARAA
jgi:hypothetical protein